MKFTLSIIASFITLTIASAAERPNIVLVMTDDQGYGDFGATGNKLIKTPHLDAMAARSVSWNEFYVSPVCSPTRACLMTGRYNHRTKCIDTFLGRSMMATDEVTIAEVLKKNGYSTGIFGKWHLGDNYPMRPSDQGFTYSLCHKGGGLGQPADARDHHGHYTDALLFENDKEIATKGYCTDVFFESAYKFMLDSQDRKKPFFAYISLNAPHSPFHDVPMDIYEKYQSTDFSSIITEEKKKTDKKEQDRLARISAMITNIDDNMGKLFTKLDKMGVSENTIVIFFTDNGPNTRRFVGPFKGKKSELYEGGVRTPMWIQWPAKLKGGVKVEKTVAAHIDFMPTLLEAAGVKEIPSKLDGRSILAKLADPAKEMPVRPLVIQYHRGDKITKYHSCMVRKGKWKLVHPSGTQTHGFKGEPKWELYDLEADQGETKNLIADQPEVKADLLAEYEKWFESVSKERLDQPGPPYIVIDSTKENPCVLTWQDMIEGSWRLEKVGYYKLDFAHGGRFDVRYEVPLWDRKKLKGKKWTAKLEIAGKTYEAPFHVDQNMGVFEALNLPAGKTTLKPSIIAEDGTVITSYHVRITHR